MTENEIRNDWKKAINTLNIEEISPVIEQGFSDQDLMVLFFIHLTGHKTERQKIEDLLEDCNFHTFCSYLYNEDYKKAAEEILNNF